MFHRGQPRQWLGAGFVLLGAACGGASVLTPHTVLRGTWVSGDMVMVATDTGVAVRQPCIGAELPPIALDDTLGFTASGVVRTSSAPRRSLRGLLGPCPATNSRPGAGS